MGNSKSIVQIIKEAATAGSVTKKVTPASENSFFNKSNKGFGHKSTKLRSALNEGDSNKYKQRLTQKQLASQILKLKDSLSELQASYGDLNELFNNTVSAQDSTVASLLQDLKYTVSRLDKADFSLRYDIASQSLFVDGEDSVAVPTADVLSMLTYLTSLFPKKSISLSIDGDEDYTDGAAVEKLTELSGEPAGAVSAEPVEPAAGDNIDDVLAGVGDSKIKDSEFEPENRFTCTYKEDTYSIWDKQLGVLVKVVTTPKEADAMLQGLVAGVTASSEPVAEEPVEGEEFTEDETVLDSKRLQDATLGLESSWEDCANFDLDKIHELGWDAAKIEKYCLAVAGGSIIPFFAQLPAFESLVHDGRFDLESAEGSAFAEAQFESTKAANASVDGSDSLDALDSFMTAYTNFILSKV
jgi:hypothetical protein